MTAEHPALAGARDEGQVGGVEGLLLGLLVFVMGVLVVVNAWGVIDAKMAVDNAAEQATRAFVQAPGPLQAYPDGVSAADDVITASGRSLARSQVDIAGSLTRCTRVVARVRYDVALITLPLIGQLGHGLVVSATESELVDPFRNNASGVATCG